MRLEVVRFWPAESSCFVYCMALSQSIRRRTHVAGDWSGWDLENSKTRLRIEVKQSAARQTWIDALTRSGKPTKPISDIAERTGYYANGSSE